LKIFPSVGKWIKREYVAVWPVFLFFVVGFILLLLLINLALAKFSIETTSLSKAVVGALVAAIAVLILDETPLARRLEHYRRLDAVVVKTFLYGAIILLLGFIERILDALRRLHNFNAAGRYAIAQANLYHFLAWALGISLVFAIYFALFEINKRMGEMGKGQLWTLFFEPPKTADDSGRHTNGTLRRGVKQKARWE